MTSILAKRKVMPFRMYLIKFFHLLIPIMALQSSLVGAPPSPQSARNEKAIADVLSGKIHEARASWWGFSSVDSTQSLQDAINSGAQRIIIEKMGSPWIVSPIQLASNQELVFQDGVIIQAKRGAFRDPNDCLFTAKLKHNITLTGQGALLRMWKSDYTAASYKKGEWRHVISLLSSTDIHITGLTLSEGGGDGIYIGEAIKGSPCQNLSISYVNCIRNYRQGISIISAKNLTIDNCIFRDTSGAAPMAGLDFEPNSPSQVLINCLIRNCRSINNRGGGFLFSLGNLDHTSVPISIQLEDCQSSGNLRDLSFWVKKDQPAKGDLKFLRCQLDRQPLRASLPKSITVTFSSCEILETKSNFNGYPNP